MSMTTRIIGFRPVDEKWTKMKAVWDSCTSAGVSVPTDVIDFFGGEAPDDMGLELNLEDYDCVRKHTGIAEFGFELLVDRLPAGVKILRFVNEH